MDNLWKPLKTDRASLNRGTQKRRIHNLKADGLIDDALCPYCGTEVYQYTIKLGFLTLSGSNHQCKNMPKVHP